MAISPGHGCASAPSLAGYTFSPASQNQTISSSNITGVNFTATATRGDVYDPTTTFLGTVTVLGSAPSNIPNPIFWGTVRVLASVPPAFAGSPIYLGAVTEGSPGPSQDDNILGQVVVLASVPTENDGVTRRRSPFLGTVNTE